MFKHYKYIVLHKTIIFWSKKQRNLHGVIQCFCDTAMFLGANLMVCLLVYMSQKDAKAHANIYTYGFLRYIINFVKIFMVNLKKKKLVCPYHRLMKLKKKKNYENISLL